jgi:hypothetical protein
MMKTLRTVAWCGFILWAQMLESGAFMPTDGFETVAECKKIQAARLEALVASGQDKLYTYACFPSDFDPRGKQQH